MKSISLKAAWNAREDVSTHNEDQETQEEYSSCLMISEANLWSPHRPRSKCSSWIWFIAGSGWVWRGDVFDSVNDW